MTMIFLAIFFIGRRPELLPMRPAVLTAFIIATALFMENMDGTVLSTSLPAIAADLHQDPYRAQTGADLLHADYRLGSADGTICGYNFQRLWLVFCLQPSQYAELGFRHLASMLKLEDLQNASIADAVSDGVLDVRKSEGRIAAHPKSEGGFDEVD